MDVSDGKPTVPAQAPDMRVEHGNGTVLELTLAFHPSWDGALRVLGRITTDPFTRKGEEWEGGGGVYDLKEPVRIVYRIDTSALADLARRAVRARGGKAKAGAVRAVVADGQKPEYVRVEKEDRRER